MPVRLLLSGVLCGLLGCGGGAASTRPVGTDGEARTDDPLEIERDVFHKASDAASFRDALQVVNSHLTDTAGLRALKKKRAQALPVARMQELFGLQPEELDYVDSVTFQPLDAHYLAEALELHEAARGLQAEGLPKLQQAELAFQWVMRQVVLHGDSDLVPPHYVLLSGQGSAQERALVFLSLLQQVNIDGCLLAFPKGNQGPPDFWAVGVLIEDQGHRDLYLFDTRLGLPLPGPGGKGIATLSQLRAQPKLLRQLTVDKTSSYDVAPDKAGSAAVYAACSLSALAPRMKVLEERLPSSGIRLSVDPVSLVTRLEAAAQGKVHPWNVSAKQAAPMRALRRFVPSDEGGLDRTARARRYEQRVRPMAAIATSLHALGLDEPASVQQRLLYFAVTLYMKYAANPHDNLVRGRLDEATRSLVQALNILREFDEARLPEAEFNKSIADWRKRFQKAQINVIRQVPDAEKYLEGLWYEDQHLHMLLAQSIDDRERERTPKKVLSFVVVRSVAVPLHKEDSYLLALCWQEKAERIEAQRLRRPTRNGKDDERANAWLNVQDWWQKYAGQYPFSTASVNSRAMAFGGLAVRPGASLGEVLEQADLYVSRWEWLVRDLSAGLQARLLQTRGLEKAGKTDAARAGLQSLVADLDAVRQDAELIQALEGAAKRIVGLRSLARNASSKLGGPDIFFGDMQARMADLQHDLAPDGSFAWMRASAAYRLAQLK